MNFFCIVYLRRTLFFYFLRFRRHYPVQLHIFRETVYKGQNDIAIVLKPLARFRMGDVAHLLRGNVELLRKDSPVAHRLIDHEDKTAVFKDVIYLAGVKQIFHVLRNRGRDAALFSETLPHIWLPSDSTS